MSISFKNLIFFNEVVGAGGFSKAAVHLRQSQPNITRAVKALELELGEILLVRSKNGVRLTPKGRLVYQLARNYQTVCDDILSELGNQKPEIRIGASENLAIHTLPRVLRAINPREFKVSVFSGTGTQIEAELSSLNLDVGVSYHRPSNPILRVKTLGVVRFVLVVPKDFRLKPSFSGREIPFIGSRSSDYPGPYFALEALRKEGIHEDAWIESNSQEAQIQMVSEGLGYSLVPKFLAEKYADRVKVRPTSASAPLYWMKRQGLAESKKSIFEKVELELKSAISD